MQDLRDYYATLVADEDSKMTQKKADEEIKNEIADNLEMELEKFVMEVKWHIKCMREASSVEEIMRIKKFILGLWAAYMPLSSDTCYFCITRQDSCTDCQYAKYHGVCEKEDSAWSKINSLRWKLYSLIANEYYRGETYHEG